MTLPPTPTSHLHLPPNHISGWLAGFRAACPSENKAEYWNDIITRYEIPLIKATYPTCYFTAIVLTNEDIDVCYFNNKGANRIGLDKRFKPSSLKRKYQGDFVPLFVWCHKAIRPLIEEIQAGKFYKSRSKLAVEPHDYFVSCFQRFVRLVKGEPVPQAPGVKNTYTKKEAPTEKAVSQLTSTTPPLGTPAQEALEAFKQPQHHSPSPFPSLFRHPITDVEFSRWVKSLPFNHWDERDLIIHYLGKPTGYIPKQRFVAMMETFLDSAKASAPTLFAAVQSRYPNKDWGHQGIETGWVDFKEI